MPELPDYTLEEIARLITEGCTSGILDDEETGRVTWSLTIEN